MRKVNKFMEDKIQKIINLIQASELDNTIKEILIRDLKSEGLTDFLKEQIKAYCVEGIKIADEEIAKANALLETHNDDKNPA